MFINNFSKNKIEDKRQITDKKSNEIKSANAEPKAIFDISEKSPNTVKFNRNDIFNMSDNFGTNADFRYETFEKSDSGLKDASDFSGTVRKTGNSAVKADSNDLAKKLYEDIRSENAFGFPTTGSNFEKHIKSINKDNVFEVLDGYNTAGKKDDYKEGLFEGIFGEKGLPMEVRKANSQHIINQLAQSCREKGINADNLIKQLNDEVNKQANSWIYADGEKLDKITDKIITLKKDYDKPSAVSERISADLKSNNTSGIKKHLAEITKDNVSDVVVAYKSKNIKNGILSDIMKNNNIDTETKKGYIRDIAGKFAEHCREKGVKCDDILKDIEGELKQECLENNNGKRLDEISIKLASRIKQTEDNKFDEAVYGYPQSLTEANGKIDGDFKQNAVGDCWLLAGLKSIANNPEALEMLNQNIKYNDKDGSVSVTLKGVNKTYTVSKEELYGSNELAKGDLDVRAIEIAVNRHFQEEYHNNSKSLCENPHKKADITGNNAVEAYKLLLGADGYEIDIDKNNPDSFINNFVKNDRFLITVSNDSGERKKITGADGKMREIYSNHAYSVVGSDDENVYVVNPHDSSVKIALSKKQFGELFNNAGVAVRPAKPVVVDTNSDDFLDFLKDL